MEIVEHLVRELGVSTRQAQGGAGLLLAFAERRMNHEDFVRVADTIPAISDIIGKAPRIEQRKPAPLREKISRLFGGLGGLAGLVRAFEKLGCDKSMVVRFVDVLASYFREKGGEEIALLLRSALR